MHVTEVICCMMRSTILSERDAVLQLALALSPNDRAYVASALEDSLDADPEATPSESLPVDEGAGAFSEAFVAELERRSTAYLSGATTSRSAEEVLADMYKRQAGEEI